MKTKRLSAKVAISTMAGVAVIIAIIYLAYLSQKEFEQTMVSQTQQQLLTIAKATARSLERFIAEHAEALKAVSMNPLFQKEVHEKIIHDKPHTEFCPIKNFYEVHEKDVDALTLLDVNGVMLHRHPFVGDRPGVDLTDKPDVAYVLREHKPYISEVFYNNLGNPAISISEPIFYKRDFAGIVRWMIETDTLSKHFIKPIKVGKKGYAQMLDERGMILAHPKPQHLGKDIVAPRKERFPDYDWSELENIVEKMTKGEEGVGLYHSAWWTGEKLERVKKLTAYVPVHMGDHLWSIGVSVGYSEIAGPINRHARNTSGLAGLVIFLFGAGGVLLFRPERRKAELKAERRHLQQIAESAEALRESEERYRTLFEDSRDAVYINTREGKFIDVNQAMLDLFGYTREEMMAKNKGELYANPDDRLRVRRVIDQKESLRDYETKYRKKDGTEMDCLITATVRRADDGSVVGYHGIVRDITEKKKLEAQLQRAQKMEALGTLAGGVAHDLNNILAGLVSYPELLLLDIPEDSPLRNPILTIQKSGEKAAAIVQDLLTLARRGIAVTEVVNVNHTISEYVKSPEHERLISFHPNVDLKTNLEKDLLNILGSPVHLSKTVMNVVSNAAEAMPDGGEISISTENRYIDKPIRGYDDVEEGDYVTLTISDTGVGISSKDRERIFEPFYTKKAMGRTGTGLGMAVVWGTVKDHEGYIDLQSAKGKGTTFTLYFPVTRKEVGKDKSIVTIEDYMGKGESVLVVDDVEEQREIASRILKKLGYSVTTVSSGEEAVDYLKDSSADLLVLDMIMDPGIDGLETYKRIIEFHPKQRALIVSGFSETKRVKEA